MQEINELRTFSDREKAAQMAAYHKVAREYLGVSVPQIDALARGWREGLDVAGRVELAARLWDSDIHEARVAATKLLTQARIRGDEPVWALISSWVPQFDGWALADHAMIAGQKRLVAQPSRLDEVEIWLTHPSFWVRRAALVGTLPWTKMHNPKPEDIFQRDRVLNWLATLADEREWFIQKAISWWLRDLSKHDPKRVIVWLDAHGQRLKPFAVKEATRLIGQLR